MMMASPHYVSIPTALSLAGTLFCPPAVVPTTVDYTVRSSAVTSFAQKQALSPCRVELASLIEANGRATVRPVANVAVKRGGLEVVFNRLAKKWKDETSGYSSVTSIVMHPAYLEIISRGEEMIPFILRDLAVKPSHWFIALKTLAKTSPVKVEDAGNIRKMSEAWLAWGRENGKLD